MTETLLEKIIRHEGFSAKPYYDSVGIATFGHGLTYITEVESEVIVNNRIEDLWPDLQDDNPWLNTAPEKVMEVLVEMQFQMGVAGTAKFKKMWAALEAGDYELAAKEGLDSKWHKQTPARAEELMTIIRNLA